MKISALRISRELAAHYGREAVQITVAGQYNAPSGQTVALDDLIERSVEGTVSYPPESSLPERHVGNLQTRISVENRTTLSAAKHLLDSGYRPAALNFASATQPGGGFLNGASAQEEYLARSSALYACLRDNPMYAYHRALRDPRYSNYAIYSPDVPVFRTEGRE